MMLRSLFLISLLIAAPVEAHGEVANARHGIGCCRHGRVGLGTRGSGAHARHGGQQLARIGLRRRLEDVAHLALLDHAAVAHDDDAVGHLGDHAHVVGDQDDAGAVPALQVAQQFQHLALHGDVERGGRLVGDQHVRLQRQRHGDHDALAHAAGKLVRILPEPAFGLGNAHRLQRLDGVLPGLAARKIGVRFDRLDQLAPDRQHRVERGHRLLEDHGDAVAADRLHCPFVEAGKVLAAEPDAAGGDAGGRLRQQPHDGKRGHRLARAGFAGDAQRFAAREREGEIGDDFPLAVLAAHGNRQAGNVEHRGGRG